METRVLTDLPQRRREANALPQSAKLQLEEEETCPHACWMLYWHSPHVTT